MQIASDVGVPYALEFTTNLVGPPVVWTQTGGVLIGTGSDITLTDSETNSPIRFYRIVRP